MPTLLEIHLNARLQPIHRGDLYEDTLQTVLDVRDPGSAVVGGSTQVSPDGEPLSCDIRVELAGDPAAGTALVIDVLRFYGAPTGSTARYDGTDPVRFGETEGLGLYLNDTDLAADVYADNDINELIDQLHERLGDEGTLQSHWQGPTETALYLYGPSAARMRELLENLLTAHPLAERSRLVPIT